ncbi:MAG: ABC transporter permease, partial [Candidatus Aminicenantes bacterium]|nr:ABC transporter permease [Candidatus Aminicenantes bacterium]
MRRLKRIFHIARNDVRIMVKDKAFFFWTLAFPVLFIVLFGLLFKASDNAPPTAELTVVNQDQGRWGAYFLEKIKSPGIELKMTESEPAEYNRLIILPPDFSAKIEARKDQALAFKKREDASVKAAARVETRLYQAIARVLSELVLYGEGDLSKFLDGHPEFRDLVQVKSRFPKNTVTVVPSGFDHS